MPKPPVPAIDALWQWWTASADRLYDAIASKELAQHSDEITQHVKQVHDDLEWEFGPGLDAEHAFCLSGKGDPLVRMLAERACLEAPDGGDRWEFHPVRLRDPGDPTRFTLAFDDLDVPLDAFRVVIEEDPSREVLHIGVWHPRYPDMPDDLPGIATFIALDHAIGEDGVETWLGAVELLEEPPDADSGAQSLAALREAVDALAGSATGERWAVLEGAHPETGKPMLLSANLALKRWAWPDHDQCGELRIHMRDPRDDGLPESDELQALNDFEDQLVESLGDDAVYLGRETGNGMRLLHVAATGRGPAEQQVAEWEAAVRADGWEVDVIWIDDPTWSVRRRWM
ncbi:MAG: DUF695 domain-containing protein [Planctomycetota bacterium]